MSQPSASECFTTHQHRIVYLAGFIFIVGVAQRRIALLSDPHHIRLAIGLLVAFTLLYAAHPWLLRRSHPRFPIYPRLYFGVQIILALLLSTFQEYLDTWLLLPICLGFQAAACFTRKEALVWGGFMIVSAFIALSFEFGGLSGFGRGMAYIIIGLFLIAFDIQYSRREDAQAESQVLLEELQLAHQKLKEQAAQGEQLSAVQERNRIAQEVHDAVGQKVFAIQLLSETTCMLLEANPQAAQSQLDVLQEQTQAALGQMRELIGRWRTPPKVGEPPAELPLPTER